MGLKRQRDWFTHPRDERLAFNAAAHVYYWDGEPVPISVTGLWESHFPRFDADATIDRFFASWASNPNSKYHALCSYLSMVVGVDAAAQKSAILSLWEAKRAEAAALGTAMHSAIEADLTGVRAADASVPELNQYLQWRKEVAADWTLVRAEWAIYDDGARVAGMIDSVWQDGDGRIFIVDWKRIKAGALERPAYRGETGTGPCALIKNTTFNHYAVQQHLYAAILKRCYDITVHGMYLVQLHPQLRHYRCVQVPPDVADVAIALLNARCE